MNQNRIGVPSARFASRGVYNICLGPRAKKEELRGERVVVAIFNKDDYVVRELREEPVGGFGATANGSDEQTYRLVDVSMTGEVTVLYDDSKTVLANTAAWVKLLDSWSTKHGISQ